MNDPQSRHPGAETMAAFLEGNLAPGEVAEVAKHLSECADCRTVAGAAARFEREDQARKPREAPAWKGWAAAAVAAIAALTAAIPLLSPAAPLAALIDASPSEYRRVESRLSGFPWAPLRGEVRGGSADPAGHELRSVAHKVLGETQDDDAVDSRHAAGVAHLLINQRVLSVESLERASGDPKADARVWNDLAAARFAVAVNEERTAELSSALVAVNRAIELDPKLAEAYFNRALIVEKLGTRDAAREAWERYLAVDPSSGWSTEARQHLRDLAGSSSGLDFRKELARAARDRDAILSLVRRFPQDARLAGEGPLLGEWADAYVANDAARAEERLAVARTIASGLAAKDEHLLSDAVRTIEERPSVDLAEAHRRFRDTRDLYRKGTRRTEAFREAELAFLRARSPMAGLAALFAAKCTFDETGEATAPLTALRARIDAKRHRALAAETDWALALQASSTADWGTAIRVSAVASATFNQLGEREYAAWMNALGAVALERIGADELAWERRVAAIAGYADQPQRVATILHTAALGLSAADHVPAATAVLDLALGTPSNSQLRSVMLTDRARLAGRAGDLTVARRLLGEARAETERIDHGMRDSRLAQINVVEAALSCTIDPARAIAILDRCVDFFRERDQIYLVDTLIERARANRAAGRDEAALADYHAALREMDRQRANASNVTPRFLDAAARAVDESIDLHLSRGEVAEAFAIADRVHADTRDYRVASVPAGTAVLEYVVLPRSVAVFCVTNDGLVAKRVPIDRAELASRVLSFQKNLKAHANVRAEATSLHTLLIAPVASRIANARELVIVPDRQLNALPFRALHDGTRYLIETYEMRVAPSIALPPTAHGPLPTAWSAVVIADPDSGRAERLPFSREEGRRIAAMYSAPFISGAEATRSRVSAAIAASSLVHYAGHADSTAGDSYGALLLAPENGDSGLLTARDIAALDLRRRPLVVLSACGTLSGRNTHIAGTPSLARTFLGAGASAVVGTLWEVDDDVVDDLFRHFHEYVRDGAVPAAALRKAQITMLQTSDPRQNHPAAWSAVEVLSNL